MYRVRYGLCWGSGWRSCYRLRYGWRTSCLRLRSRLYSNRWLTWRNARKENLQSHGYGGKDGCSDNRNERFGRSKNSRRYRRSFRFRRYILQKHCKQRCNSSDFCNYGTMCRRCCLFTGYYRLYLYGWKDKSDVYNRSAGNQFCYRWKCNKRRTWRRWYTYFKVGCCTL